jgi:hypothetical protein
VPCSQITGTAGVGSMVTLHFGPLYPETTSLSSFGTTTHAYATFRLAMGFAAWRCACRDGGLCSSSTPSGAGSPMEMGLARLVGKRLVAVHLDRSTYDLRVEFAGGSVLSVFCDQVDVAEGHDNYSFRFESGWWIIGPGCQLRVEHHKHG